MQISLRQVELDSRVGGRQQPVLPASFKKALVVGLGKVTGAAVTDALLDLGVEVRIAERDKDSRTQQMASEMARRGVEVVFDDHETSLVVWADVVVPSPGVPPSNPLLMEAQRLDVPILSEIEIGWRLANGPVIAITGTNGKTTTTELLTGILKAGSAPSFAAGNIGTPLIEAVRSQPPGTIFVTEVSSFQLAYIEHFRPRVAVVLNVADDHYDWHGDAASYLAAKARITENQRAGDLLLAGAGSPGSLSIAAGSRAEVGIFGIDSPASLRRRARSDLGRDPLLAAGIADNKVVVSSPEGEVVVMDTADIRLAGPHNLENTVGAAAAAFYLECPVESIEKGVRQFKALPHRMNVIAERNGITYIDDSKATNPHAALAALKGLQDVILIAGGRSKGISLAPLAEAADICKGAVVMGEAAAELKKVLGRLPVREAAGVEEAVEHAAGMARPGYTVLLSPGCSSLDQYSGYAERGDRFIRAVGELS